jgi:hypothetical protein
MSESIVLEPCLCACEEHKRNEPVATDEAEILGRFESAPHPT